MLKIYHILVILHGYLSVSQKDETWLHKIDKI